MVHNGFDRGIFSLPNQPVVGKLEKSSLSEKPSLSGKSNWSEHSGNYYKYISPETGISVGGIKLLTPKQISQKLPIACVQVKAGNLSENVLNEIHQIIYSLYQAK